MTEHITISRSEIIDHLARSMFDDLEMNPEKIDDLILNGFRGYTFYNNAELIAEYKEYISPEFPESVTITLED
jgi:hypothetical protein